MIVYDIVPQRRSVYLKCMIMYYSEGECTCIYVRMYDSVLRIQRSAIEKWTSILLSFESNKDEIAYLSRM